jgi:DNA-directed RNA polymerase subunit K/omega
VLLSAESNGPAPQSAAAPHGLEGLNGDRFYMIALIFQRARQLQHGARPRVYKDGHKPIRLAQLEVEAGLISWELTPEPARPQL